MASGNAPSTLYDALTGNSTLIDAGEGTRQKAWLDAVPRWLQEAAEPLPLAGLALGRLVNFPAFIEGDRELKSNPIGGDTNPIDPFNGVEISEVVKNTVQLGLGDGSETDFGQETLSVPDPASDTYATGGTDGASPVPRGGQHPAFVSSDDETFNLSATNGILTIIVNGVTHTVTIGTGASVTAEVVRQSIVNSGVPVQVVGRPENAAIDAVRLLTLGRGVAETIQVSAAAGTAGAVIFATSGNTLFRGAGGPLNDVRNLASGGLRAIRRVLPGSVVITATVSSAVVTLTDSGKDGVLDDGTGTHTGTIDYADGDVNIDFGTAPDNATAVVATYKSLLPLTLSDPVRIPVGGKELALRLL